MHIRTIALGGLTFEAFWVRYLRAHRRPGTRLLHYFATSIGIMAALDALITGNPLVLAAGIGAGYAVAIFAHRFIEGNQPLIKVSVFWGALADMRMCWLALTGGLERELARHAALADAALASEPSRFTMLKVGRALLLAGSAVGLALVVRDLGDLSVAPHSLLLPVIQLGVPIVAFLMALAASVGALTRFRSGGGAPSRDTAGDDWSLMRAGLAFVVTGSAIFGIVELVEHLFRTALPASVLGIAAS